MKNAILLLFAATYQRVIRSIVLSSVVITSRSPITLRAAGREPVHSVSVLAVLATQRPNFFDVRQRVQRTAEVRFPALRIHLVKPGSVFTCTSLSQ